MKPSQFYKMLDLLEDIKGVEKMINLHLNDGSDFMLQQYKAKKETLTSDLIDQLASPPLRSERSIHTIKMIIERFYGSEMVTNDNTALNDDFSKLEHALAS